MPERNPMEIAEQIRDVVPKEHKTRFNHLINDFSYKAPEQAWRCWKRLSVACNTLLKNGCIEHPWQLEMISILTMMTKEEILSLEKLRNDRTKPSQD